MYPPVPTGLPRVVPKGGAVISGRFVPENVSVEDRSKQVSPANRRKTIVAIHQWATYHREANFKDPFDYHPERFLADDQNSDFADDKRDALQPFHIGPRNCLGRKYVISLSQYFLS